MIERPKPVFSNGVYLYNLNFVNEYLSEFSRLTVVKQLKSIVRSRGKKESLFLCKCSCGKQIEVTAKLALSGQTKSCGCYQKECLRLRSIKCINSTVKLNRIYHNMISRCYLKSHRSYKYYGGKGVVVCDEWRNNYELFCEWAVNNGWKDGLQLDKDIKGNGLLYSPNTCCFVTGKDNINNRSISKKYNYGGRLLTLAQIRDETNIPYSSLQRAICINGELPNVAVNRLIGIKRNNH